MRLPVEDDAIFICEAYNELPAVAHDGGTQHIYLGDGELDVRVSFDGGIAHMTTTHSPFLDKNQTRILRERAPLERYAGAWERLIQAILSID